MEEVGAQVAPPIFIHPALSNRYRDAVSVPQKRDLSYQTSNFQLHHQPAPQQQQQQQQRQRQRQQSFVQNTKDSWNPKAWEWDSVRFVGKPLDDDILHLGAASSEKKKDEASWNSFNLKHITVEEDD